MSRAFQGWTANETKIPLDVIVWSLVNIIAVHGSGVLAMYMDERPVKLLSGDHARLWRFFYRHSGLSKGQFKSLIAPTLELVSFEKGTEIRDLKEYFYIVLRGAVDLEIVHSETGHSEKATAYSSDMFPVSHLNLNNFVARANFTTAHRLRPVVVSDDGAKLFRLPVKTLASISKVPRGQQAFSAMQIAILSSIAERPYLAGTTKNDDVISKGAEISPLFGPLTPSEIPDPLMAGSGMAAYRPIAHAWRYVKSSIYAPWPIGHWPVGLRHSLPAPTSQYHQIGSGDGGGGDEQQSVTETEPECDNAC